ncbi:MAG TPA: hypothetical protein VNN79_09230 [Actinomycetota bacterium]|nr:hypothetical protein [Actinomycetota bacterium]
MAADVRKRTSDARRYIEGALGNLTPSGARDMARGMVEGAQGFAGQGPSGMANQIRDLAQQVMEWSQQNRETVMETVQREIRRQLKAIGLATTDDLDALRKRVRELEKAAEGASAKPAPKRSTAKKRTSTKSAAKRTSAAKRMSSGSASSSSSPSASSGSEGSEGSADAGANDGGSPGSGGDAS